MKNPILYVGIVMLDEIEMLSKQVEWLSQISGIYVAVALQKYSWSGRKVKDISKWLIDLPINHVTWFEDYEITDLYDPDYVRLSKHYSTCKKQKLLDHAKSINAQYYLSSDVDEFYVPAQLQRAIWTMSENSVDWSLTKYFNYVTPTKCRGLCPTTMPFIGRVVEDMYHGREGLRFMGTYADPCRSYWAESYDECNMLQFDITDPYGCPMHHYEYWGRPTAQKYRDCSREFLDRNRIEDIDRIISRVDETTDYVNFDKVVYPWLGNQRLLDCKDYFGLSHL